ncbi:TonB-dependent receptor [Brevundimonas sp. VNH65]|uniref:TonB-dependent receptor n=1 Tax=Brevundimonas sp. VNH65 TaxID=3400917 RepID=UPI003C1143F7
MNSSKRGVANVLMSGGSHAVIALVAGLALAGPALAQSEAPVRTAPQDDDATQVEEVVVTGFRASLQSALDAKRRSNVMVDVIDAEDIADFPDANLAESLQRLPGVTIDRDNGEGRTITVRGLGPDFTRVRLNGLEALSTAGGNDSGSTPNRSRGFDFNTFASELFSSLRVQKTASAEVDEGSLGATIDLVTGRPFNFAGRRAGLSIQNAHYENGGRNSLKAAGLISDRWETSIGQLGFTGSVSYSDASRITDSYSRQPASFDYASAQSWFAPTLNATAPANGIPQRQGFAAPIGTPCNGGTVAAPILNGLVPGLNVTRAAACDNLRGSNPAAYALIYPNGGAVRSFQNGATVVTQPGSIVRLPTLPTLNQQELDQERLGLTAALQWRPSDRTTVSLDGVYSKFEVDSRLYQISTIGLNRANNTSSAYYTATSGSAALYSSCGVTGAGGQSIQCQGSEGSGAVLPGFANSTNPNNLNAFDYYNNPASVGYIPTGNNLAMIDALVGKPSTWIMDASVDNSNPNSPIADYLVLGNLDLRSANDQNTYTTEFQQVSATIEHQWTDRLKMTVVAGMSKSTNESLGLLSDLIRLDSGRGGVGDGYFVYDARDGGDMPVIDFGFDAADPTKWDTVKGYSVLRVQARSTENTFENVRTDFAWDVFEGDQIKFGAALRRYGFDTQELRRASQEAISPTLLEAGSTVAATGRVIEWGMGLDVPAGTTTRFWTPDNAKMAEVFGFDCNCVNKYGDFRLTPGGASNNLGLNYDIAETDTGAYVQYDYDRSLFGMPFRGNVGVRYALTEVEAGGLTTIGTPITNTNRYEDILPSLNSVLTVRDNLLLRFGIAKVMARPSLSQLAPGITSFNVPGTVGATTGGSISSGNTKLKPFRTTTTDLSLEWYFAPGALFGVAIFNKEVDTFPQRVLAEGRLSEFLDPSVVEALRASLTATTPAGDAQRAYVDADNPFNFSQPRDAPGGYIRGFEVNYQQNLTFLPGWLSNFGIQANYTHIESELSYIIDTGSLTAPVRPQLIGKAPFLGASPDSLNFTLYYETEKWSGRVSAAHRAEYFTTYPLQTGSCAPGFCPTPLINDFAGSQATTNVDASFSYRLTPRMSFTVEGLNLTNQTSNRFAYDGSEVVTQYASTGRQYFLGFRATF